MNARENTLRKDVSAALPAHVSKAAAAALSARDVTRSFGAVKAVDSVSLQLRPGEIHGLIGPNGSGKTTMLNLLCGFYPVTSGNIAIGSRDVTAATVQQRSAAGIARTFQKPRLLNSLSVLDNAMLGGWNSTRSGFLAAALATPRARRENADIRARAEEILCGVGLREVLDRPAGNLDHAEQRFLEIARSLVAQPSFLLLDEPAGGLTEHEIAQLAAVVGTVRNAGIGVLLVEHHTDFVFKICDRVTTLNLGATIKHGTPDEVRNDPEVIAVYLGA